MEWRFAQPTNLVGFLVFSKCSSCSTKEAQFESDSSPRSVVDVTGEESQQSTGSGQPDKENNDETTVACVLIHNDDVISGGQEQNQEAAQSATQRGESSREPGELLVECNRKISRSIK